MNAQPQATESASAGLWPLVQQFMLRHTGNVLRDEQAYLLDSRLPRAIKPLGFTALNEFIFATCVANPKPEHAATLIEAMTTHETSFFRDKTFWDQIRSAILPELAQKMSDGRNARIWCAACSTGQEPYSLAMMIRDVVPQLAARIEIVATDIAKPTLAHAREGFYSSLETNRGLDIKHLAKFFTQAPGGFRAKDELRNAIKWQQHNLLGLDTDPINCDVVLCRNVLIYFSETDRNIVLKRLLKATMPNGVFGLGSTESCREAGLQSIAVGLYRKT